MQFMTALFGGTAGTLINAAFALGIVLVLVVLTAWLLKFVARGGAHAGRNARRLVVVETAMVDSRRKVLLIRRDDVEHVVMTGGPQDLVIESGIPVQPVPARQHAPRPAAQAAPRADVRAEVHAPAPSAAPPAPDHPVSRDALDRLNELARPAPLKPRTALRHTALLRPVPRQDGDIIPIGPALRVDNSAGLPADSANTGAGGAAAGGQSGLGSRNRFFRSVVRDRS